MDNLITTIIIVAGGIYVYKKFWANDSEKSVEGIVKNYSERIEHVKGSKILKDWDKKYEDLMKRLSNTYEAYLHLLEKYRHNIKMQWDLRQDWRVYIQSHKDIQESDMDYGMDLNDKQLQKSKEREYRAEIRIKEIEKRFESLN